MLRSSLYIVVENFLDSILNRNKIVVFVNGLVDIIHGNVNVRVSHCHSPGQPDTISAPEHPDTRDKL